MEKVKKLGSNIVNRAVEDSDIIEIAPTSSSVGEIIFNIDVMLAKRKMSVTELSERVGITMANISILKNGKARAIRVTTLAAICAALDCQPGDILEFRKND